MIGMGLFLIAAGSCTTPCIVSIASSTVIIIMTNTATFYP